MVLYLKTLKKEKATDLRKLGEEESLSLNKLMNIALKRKNFSKDQLPEIVEIFEKVKIKVSDIFFAIVNHNFSGKGIKQDEDLDLGADDFFNKY